MTEECRKEIINYVHLKGFSYKGYDNIQLFGDDYTINRGHYLNSEGSTKRKIKKRYGRTNKVTGGWIELDKYFLEFIGHILRKYMIYEVDFGFDNTYQSIDWKFEDIKRISN